MKRTASLAQWLRRPPSEWKIPGSNPFVHDTCVCVCVCVCVPDFSGVESIQ